MNITVVGGGFGGVKTALEIAKNRNNSVTLITDKPDFQYYPALYSSATGRSHLQSWVPLEQIFRKYSNVTVIIDSIASIDDTHHVIKGATGETYPYETLVLALGAVTTYFGIKGLDTYAYGIKSAQEIQRLKRHLYGEFIKDHKLDKHYVIVGAGPTGVELASALGSYLENLRKYYNLADQKIKIDLVEAAPRVLPRMSESASRKVEARLTKLGVNVEIAKIVESETADILQVSGQPIESHTVVWTSGVSNHPFFKAHDTLFTLAKNGKVIVDDYLRVNENIYVIGDNAATQFSGLAQTALRDASYVARAIGIFNDGRLPRKYSAKLPPVVVPVGENWAVFEWKSIRISGYIASLIRIASDIIGYSDILPFWQALGLWRTQKRRDVDYYAPVPVSVEE